MVYYNCQKGKPLDKNKKQRQVTQMATFLIATNGINSPCNYSPWATRLLARIYSEKAGQVDVLDAETG